MAYRTRKCASRRRKAYRRKTSRRRKGGSAFAVVDTAPKDTGPELPDEAQHILDLVASGQLPVRSHF